MEEEGEWIGVVGAVNLVEVAPSRLKGSTSCRRIKVCLTLATHSPTTITHRRRLLVIGPWSNITLLEVPIGAQARFVLRPLPEVRGTVKDVKSQ